jgi:hypothetical protein
MPNDTLTLLFVKGSMLGEWALRVVIFGTVLLSLVSASSVLRAKGIVPVSGLVTWALNVSCVLVFWQALESIQLVLVRLAALDPGAPTELAVRHLRLHYLLVLAVVLRALLVIAELDLGKYSGLPIPEAFGANKLFRLFEAALRFAVAVALIATTANLWSGTPIVRARVGRATAVVTVDTRSASSLHRLFHDECDELNAMRERAGQPTLPDRECIRERVSDIHLADSTGFGESLRREGRRHAAELGDLRMVFVLMILWSIAAAFRAHRLDEHSMRRSATWSLLVPLSAVLMSSVTDYWLSLATGRSLPVAGEVIRSLTSHEAQNVELAVVSSVGVLGGITVASVLSVRTVLDFQRLRRTVTILRQAGAA